MQSVDIRFVNLRKPMDCNSGSGNLRATAFELDAVFRSRRGTRTLVTESHNSSSADRIPLEDELDRFAIPYSPENFTLEEQTLLRPFFSNLDRPVFVVQHLPEEVIGAL